MNSSRILEQAFEPAALAPEEADLVGSWTWDPAHASLLDFEQVDLHADGTYEAKVEATLLHAGVRTFGAKCMLPEEGRWNAYAVGTAIRLRIRPTTGRARIYVVTSDARRLVLSRRGSTTTLLREGSSSGICRVADAKVEA